jgi:hypothetical protein
MEEEFGIQFWEFLHLLQGFKLENGLQFLLICLEFD